jgi:translation initiation factor IF-2
LKIRIFALAKELDMDSKLLIDFCAKAGISVKNSALASISPEERDQVLELIQSSGGSGSVAAPVAPAKTTAAPARDELAMGRVRELRTIATRPQPVRSRPSHADEVEAETAASVEESTEDEVRAVVSDIDTSQDVEAPPVEETAPVAAEATETPVEAAAEAEPVAEAVNEAAEVSSETSAAPASPSKPAPLSRGDYISSHGASRSLRSMDMVARGTTESTGSRTPPAGGPAAGPLSGARKSRSRFASPLIADIPNFVGPASKTPKPEEAKAQKPTFRLNQPEALQKGSPLADHLRKSADSKKRKPGDEEPAEVRRDLRGKTTGDALAGAGLEESRAQRRDKRRQTQQVRDEEEEQRQTRLSGLHKRRFKGKTELKSEAVLELPITVRTLSEAIGRPAKSIIQILWARGAMVTINSGLEEDTAIELAVELGVDLRIQRDKDFEDVLEDIVDAVDDPSTMVVRPPIVTILGHVDHGKTTLIDRLRSSNVAAGEHGGITQHIAAYQVEHNGQKLTFVDTPGHAAFGEMRARGANVTDIVVLVVAANDGVMPQTLECISHAKAAGVPIVVALNKCDLPDRNEQRVLQELAAQNVLASEWGGDVEVVRTSGLTGQGLPDLLDTLLLTAELHEYKGNPSRPANGACLEAFRDEGRGALAWLLVQSGTLRVGDVVVCGETYGRVRAMYNEYDQEIAEAPPSTPIKVAGLEAVPNAGDQFVVMPDIEHAREIAAQRHERGRAAVLATKGGRRTMEDILNAAREGQIQDLALVVKADTPGSLEALRNEINKFSHPEVRVKILHEGVGGVNESDVYLAAASEAVIIAFHVIAEDRAEQLAIQEGVQVKRYNIIYEVISEIRNILEGMLRPEKREVVTGRAIVLRTFNISRFGTIAGCRVLNGTIERSHRVHLIRDQKILNAYGIGSLRREKDDVKEVREGMECGIRLENFNDVKEGDLFEAYRIEEIRRTLD